MSVPYPVFQLQDMEKGVELHSCRVLNGLCHLVHMIIETGPVKDPHAEQAEQHRIVNSSLIYPSKPLHSLDHVHPELIVKEEIWVYISPPLVLNNSLVIRLILLDHPVVGILGYL